MTGRADCAVSAGSPRLLSVKAPAPLVSPVGEPGVGPWASTTLRPPQLPASEIKQTRLSTNLASLLASEWQAAGHIHPFSNNFTKCGWPLPCLLWKRKRFPYWNASSSGASAPWVHYCALWHFKIAFLALQTFINSCEALEFWPLKCQNCTRLLLLWWTAVCFVER